MQVDGETINYGQIHSMIHRDISVGNDYRKERIKHLMTLATGVFAVTVTFHKDVFGSSLTPVGLCLMVSSWGALIVSLFTGIIHLQKWEDFYLEHRALGNGLWQYRIATGEEQKRDARIAFNRARKKITKLQRSYKGWNVIQWLTLLSGLAFIATYIAFTGTAVLSEAKQKDHIQPCAQSMGNSSNEVKR